MMKTWKNIPWKVLLFGAIIAFTSSCASRKNIILLQDPGSKEASNVFSNKGKSSYKIHKGDNLYIKIYSVDEKTAKFFQADLPSLVNPTYMFLNSYTVDEEGYIHISFINKLKVEGQTLEDAKNQIQKTLNEYFKETTVVLKLVNFQVTVLGEVNSAGSFTIDKEQINIFQAIGLAGGMKNFGNGKKVTLVRQTDSGSEVIPLDLTDRNILASDYYYLMPNDMIYIEPLKARSNIDGSNFTTIAFSSATTILLLLSILLR